jgi:hypothetical protein
LILEEPVTQIDGQINLVGFRNLKLCVSFLLHENSDELIANLRCMLCVVDQAELLTLRLDLPLGLLLKLDTLGLKLLRPAQVVQALAKEDGIGKRRPVELLVDPLRELEKIEREDLIDKHLLAFDLTEVFIVAADEGCLPLFRLGARRCSRVLLEERASLGHF